MEVNDLFFFAGMYHLLFHLQWQPRGKNLKGKSVSQFKLQPLIFFSSSDVSRCNVCLLYFVERGGKAKGEREREVKKH